MRSAMTSSSILILTLIIALLTGCSQEEKNTESPHTALPEVSVSTSLIKTETAWNQSEIVGTLQAVNAADISAKISGNIISLPVDLGTRVKKGDLLVEIQAGEISAQLRQAATQLDQARRNLSREEVLLKKNAATSESVKTLREGLKIAEAAYQEALTIQDYTRILAPFSGIITKKSANIGDLATPGKILLNLEDETRLQVVTDFPEKMMLKVKSGDQMEVLIPSIESRLTATVAEVSPIASPSSRTVPVKLDLPENNRLRSGQFARVSLTGESTQTIMVPSSAISPYGQIDRVFIVDDGHAYLRLVRTGLRVADRVELLSGVEAGEEIVVDNIDKLIDGQPVTILPNS